MWVHFMTSMAFSLYMSVTAVYVCLCECGARAAAVKRQEPVRKGRIHTMHSANLNRDEDDGVRDRCQG